MSTQPPYSGEQHPFGTPVHSTAKAGSGSSNTIVIVLIVVAVVGVMALVGCGILGALLLPAVQSARTAARRMGDSNSMKEIGLAMHNHHDINNRLPAVSLTNEAGQATLSWRVALCQTMDSTVFQSANPNESWDAASNQPLLNRMPSTFKSLTTENPSMSQSQMHVIAAPDPAPGQGARVAFSTDPTVSRKFRDFKDGLSNTALAICLPTYSVDWTKPGYISPDDAFNRLVENGGANVLLGDGAVVFISGDISKTTWDALTTIDGGEMVGAF